MNDQLAGKVSSFRRGGPVDSPGNPVRQTDDDVLLWSGDNGQGQSFGLARNTADLVEVGFKDVARSLRVRDGRWTLCSDKDYQGYCESYGPGLHQLGLLLYRHGSSIRRDDGKAAHHKDKVNKTVVLYEGRDGGGPLRQQQTGESHPGRLQRPHPLGANSSRPVALLQRGELQRRLPRLWRRPAQSGSGSGPQAEFLPHGLGRKATRASQSSRLEHIHFMKCHSLLVQNRLRTRAARTDR